MNNTIEKLELNELEAVKGGELGTLILIAVISGLLGYSVGSNA